MRVFVGLVNASIKQLILTLTLAVRPSKMIDRKDQYIGSLSWVMSILAKRWLSILSGTADLPNTLRTLA